MKLTNRKLKQIILEELRLVTEETIAQQMAADRARQRAGELEGERGYTAVHRGEAEDVQPTHPEFVDKAGEWLLARTGQNQLGGKIVRGMEDFGTWGGPVGRGFEKYVMTPGLRDPVERWAAGLAPQNIDWVEHERQRQAERRAGLPGIFDFGDRTSDQEITDLGDPMIEVEPNRESWGQPNRPDWSQYGPSDEPVTQPRVDTSRLAGDPRVVRFHDDAPGEAERRAARFAIRTGQIPSSSLSENYLSLNEMIEQEIDRILLLKRVST